MLTLKSLEEHKEFDNASTNSTNADQISSVETVISSCGTNTTVNMLDLFYSAVHTGDLTSTKQILGKLFEVSEKNKVIKLVPELHQNPRHEEDGQQRNSVPFSLTESLDVEKVLKLAAQARHVEVLEFLLQSLPFNKQTTGTRLLELALELRHAETVKCVLDCGVNVDERINGSYIRWGSLVTYTFPLHEATTAGDEATVRLLIQRGAEVDWTDSDGNTALMLACAGSSSSLGVLRLLLEAGADINLTDFNDRSALVIAAALNKTDMISLISSCGGQVSERMLLRACEISSVGESALSLLLQTLPDSGLHVNWYRLLLTAAHFSKPERVQALVNYMPTVLKRPGPRAQDILTSALRNKNYGEKIADTLLKEDFITADGADSNKDRPLNVAVKYCSPAFCYRVSELVDGDSVDGAGRTPLMTCLYRDRHEDSGASSAQTAVTIMAQLLLRGCDVTARDALGRTCLHHAVSVGNSEAVATLIRVGIDVAVCNQDGRNSLDLAWMNTFHTHPFSPETDVKSAVLSGQVCTWVEDEDLRIQRHCRLYLENRSEVMGSLLKAGARFTQDADRDWVLITLLHFKLDHLIPLVIGKGVFPQCLQDAVKTTTIKSTFELNTSPFSLAVYMGNFRIALFFHRNGFLTGEDLQLLHGHVNFRNHVDRKLSEKSKSPGAQIFQRFVLNTCSSLQLLSFVTVSDLLGTGNGREDRLKNLGLPPAMQRRLLFLHIDREFVK